MRVTFRSVHRIVSALFLVTIPLATYAGATGNDDSPLIYFPLAPLALLTITGTWLLVKPWIGRMRKRRTAA